MRAFSESFQKELGKRLAQAIALGLLVLFSVAGISLPRDMHTARLVLLCLAGLSLLALSSGLLFRYLSSHRDVGHPVSPARPAPTPQEIRQQRLNQQMEVLSQFQKPSNIAFEVLKRLAMNPRDGSLDVQGVACLFYEGSFSAAKSCLQELIGFDYVERAGPAMPGEWNNHYKITERGIACVNIHAV
jgi:hypothetical protein